MLFFLLKVVFNSFFETKVTHPFSTFLFINKIINIEIKGSAKLDFLDSTQTSKYLGLVMFSDTV